MVCRPKDKGGVGILNLKVQNEALLLKYLHKFYNKVNTPWVKLIWNTYYREKIHMLLRLVVLHGGEKFYYLSQFIEAFHLAQWVLVKPFCSGRIYG
jgi:hypothetical protein